ncbi:MAG: glycosyltransferase [Bacteroides sp.]|nr:glycosyltransferase [Bacteroides sp.]
MIGLFNDCFPPIMDGVSVTTSNYAYWLNRKRGDVCVVTPQAPAATDDTAYPVYRYLSLPIPMRKPYRLGFPRIDWPFHRQISRIPFELVHAHCPFSSGTLARSIARTHHIPLVATFHSKYRSDFERVIPNRYVIDHLIRSIVSFYEQADEVWIPQASVEQTLREYGYKGRVEVVDNGNDFADTPYSPLRKLEARRALGLDARVPVLLFVGQHIWEKNVAFLLRSLARLTHVPFRMMFVGTGYAADEMKQLADKLGLTHPDEALGGAPRVSFVGAIHARESLKRYYMAADLFLFPSLYDNAPLVVREAAALHTPSLLIQGSTAAEIVSDGVNGFLCAADERTYADRIQGLMDSPQLLEDVGACAARQLARSWRDIADEVNDRYIHLMKRHCC